MDIMDKAVKMQILISILLLHFGLIIFISVDNINLIYNILTKPIDQIA